MLFLIIFVCLLYRLRIVVMIPRLAHPLVPSWFISYSVGICDEYLSILDTYISFVDDECDYSMMICCCMQRQ